MKKLSIFNFLLLFINASIVILLSFMVIEELTSDFYYWGFQQWPWFYETKEIYLIYNAFLLSFMSISIFVGMKLMKQNKKVARLLICTPFFYVMFWAIYSMYFILKLS